MGALDILAALAEPGALDDQAKALLLIGGAWVAAIVTYVAVRVLARQGRRSR